MNLAVMVHIVIIIPFLIFAFVLSKGTGADLIAGYNTKSESERAEYDEVALCKFMGKIMFGICFGLLLWLFAELFVIQGLFTFGLILIIGLTVYSVIYINTGNRFKRKFEGGTYDEEKTF